MVYQSSILSRHAGAISHSRLILVGLDSERQWSSVSCSHTDKRLLSACQRMCSWVRFIFFFSSRIQTCSWLLILFLLLGSFATRGNADVLRRESESGKKFRKPGITHKFLVGNSSASPLEISQEGILGVFQLVCVLRSWIGVSFD